MNAYNFYHKNRKVVFIMKFLNQENSSLEVIQQTLQLLQFSVEIIILLERHSVIPILNNILWNPIIYFDIIFIHFLIFRRAL